MVVDHARTFAKLLTLAKSVVVLTGAGISTNAGIPDFRGPRGLFVTKQYDASRIFDIDVFFHDPTPFYDFAHDFLSLYDRINPTLSHQFLSKLERQGKIKAIITQNIDALHQRAGSQNVFEMHGSFLTSHCIQCGTSYSLTQLRQRMIKNYVPQCDCQAVIKPDIVFFGEQVKHYDRAINLASDSDLFVVIGSSCVVYPAAVLPTLTQGEVVIVNKGDVSLSMMNVVMHVQDDSDAFFSSVDQHIDNSF